MDPPQEVVECSGPSVYAAGSGGEDGDPRGEARSDTCEMGRSPRVSGQEHGQHRSLQRGVVTQVPSSAQGTPHEVYMRSLVSTLDLSSCVRPFQVGVRCGRTFCSFFVSHAF